MSIFDEASSELRQFPAALRKLVEDELEAGNEIAELGHGFPAAPCGAFIKLARPVSTRDRIATAELDYYDRDSSSYSGEFTDSKRHFFVLEPPHPPESPSDVHANGMQSIRRAIDAEYAANEASQVRDYTKASERTTEPLAAGANSIVSRFAKSMELTYDRWHDGEGYDIALIAEADERTRDAIEAMIIRRSPMDWRDIEALAVLDSTRARVAIMNAFRSGSAKTRMAVHAYAPQLLSDTLRTDSILRALREAEIYTGLSETLNEIEDFHPPVVIEELLNGLMKRDGGTACHFAAMLYFLHGKASSAFDWDHRPFFLRFNTEDRLARKVAFRELCESIGINPAHYL